jgi:hypothetical protein
VVRLNLAATGVTELLWQIQKEVMALHQAAVAVEVIMMAVAAMVAQAVSVFGLGKGDDNEIRNS